MAGYEWTAPDGRAGRVTGKAAEVVRTYWGRNGSVEDEHQRQDWASRIQGAGVAFDVLGDSAGRQQLWALVDALRDGPVAVRSETGDPDPKY